MGKRKRVKISHLVAPPALPTRRSLHTHKSIALIAVPTKPSSVTRRSFVSTRFGRAGKLHQGRVAQRRRTAHLKPLTNQPTDEVFVGLLVADFVRYDKTRRAASIDKMSVKWDRYRRRNADNSDVHWNWFGRRLSCSRSLSHWTDRPTEKCA